MDMVYRITRDGKPQGCEYKKLGKAVNMMKDLAQMYPGFSWDIVECEPDALALDEGWIRTLLI